MRLPAPASPERLDRFLVSAVAGLSRARAAALIAEGRVRVNGRRGVKGARVGPEDSVEVEGEVPPADWTPRPDPDVAVTVRLEDEALLVLDKPAGIPTHPLRPDESGTVAGWIAASRPETMGIGYGPREPGIVHRLDVGTSGLLLVAKTEAAFRRLRDDLRAGRISKEYLALVSGRPPASGTISLPISDSSRGRVRVCRAEASDARTRARPAVTRWETVRRLGDSSLVRAMATKAARHQIRAHLAAIGHPLLGDGLYGGPETAGLTHHALHAAALSFAHPSDGRPVRVESPLPPDLQALVDAETRR